MGNFYINKDVLIHRRADCWTLMNVRAFTHVELSLDTLRSVEYFLDGKNLDHNSVDYYACDRTYFSNLYCLVGDPTRFLDDVSSRDKTNSSAVTIENFNPQFETYSDFESIISLLKKRHIITDSSEEYAEYFAAKNSLFDPDHIGTFHQQIGLNLLENLRTTSDRWWPTQKFDQSGELLKNAYKFIEFSFFQNFFSAERVNGKRILDLGCGTGFYSRHFLQNGAQVCGVDPNKEYIDLARNACRDFPTAEFVVGLVEEGNDSLDESELFDIIYISDMFLFYTKGISPDSDLDPSKLLNAVKKHLKPDGYIYLTEPHGIFWQTPWMGEKELPFTIVSEYLNKKQGVTPTLSEITKHFFNSDLAILEIFEPKPTEQDKETFGQRAYTYTSEFPLWWTFILTHKPKIAYGDYNER